MTCEEGRNANRSLKKINNRQKEMSSSLDKAQEEQVDLTGKRLKKGAPGDHMQGRGEVAGCLRGGTLRRTKFQP